MLKVVKLDTPGSETGPSRPSFVPTAAVLRIERVRHPIPAKAA